MEIEPTYVTFEQAKWLKEKGFNTPVRQRWSIVENVDGDKSPFLQEESGLFDWNNNTYLEYTSAPEQHQVVEWLRVNHGIIVSVLPDNDINFINTQKVIFTPTINIAVEGLYNLYRELIRDCEGNGISCFNSPQEAYSAAFDYILNNLI